MASLGNTFSVHGSRQRVADVSPEQVPVLNQNSCIDSEHHVSFQECLGKRRAVHSGTGDHRFTRLVSTIEGEIIPRLMLVHRSATDIPPARSGIAAIPSPEEVAELAKIAVEQDAEAASAYIEAIRARGISFAPCFSTCWRPPHATWANGGTRISATSRKSPLGCGDCSRSCVLSVGRLKTIIRNTVSARCWSPFPANSIPSGSSWWPSFSAALAGTSTTRPCQRMTTCWKSCAARRLTSSSYLQAGRFGRRVWHHSSAPYVGYR